MQSVKNVDEYIALAPKEVQAKLRQLRALILSVVPDAQERISYGLAYYAYKGRLVYFGFAKRHIGLYVPTPVLAEHADDLKGYESSAATVHLPLDQELPKPLIIKLVTARMKKNEQAENSK